APCSSSPTTAWASRSVGPDASTPTACSACGNEPTPSAPCLSSSPKKGGARPCAAGWRTREREFDDRGCRQDRPTDPAAARRRPPHAPGIVATGDGGQRV